MKPIFKNLKLLFEQFVKLQQANLQNELEMNYFHFFTIIKNTGDL